MGRSECVLCTETKIAGYKGKEMANMYRKSENDKNMSI